VLAGEPRIDFERLLAARGITSARYDVADYEQDLRGITEAERRAGPS
jgi:predicted HTH domain antitoxin